ncbi:hypothetical protein, partial [Eggerthella sp.]|uniref:hypothetical protein n=1 Tax=Eggerthella sp. TaxID=1929886 RepID=UPI002913D8D2
ENRPAWQKKAGLVNMNKQIKFIGFRRPGVFGSFLPEKGEPWLRPGGIGAYGITKPLHFCHAGRFSASRADRLSSMRVRGGETSTGEGRAFKVGRAAPHDPVRDPRNREPRSLAAP